MDMRWSPFTIILFVFLHLMEADGQWVPVVYFPDSGINKVIVNENTGMIASSIGLNNKYVYHSRGINGTWNAVPGPWDSLYTHIFGQVLLSNGTILMGTKDFSVQNKIFIWRSTDGAASWKCVTGSLNDIVYYFQECGSYVLAAIGKDSIYRSSDWGTSWSKVFEFPKYHERETVSMTAIGDRVFAQMYMKYDPPHLFRSTDFGSSWNRTNYGERADRIIAVGSRLFAEASYLGIWYSDDEGGTWRSMNDGLNADTTRITSLATDGRNLFAAGYESIYMLPAGGDTWIDIGQGLPALLSAYQNGWTALVVYRGNLFAGMYQTGASPYVLWRRPLSEILSIHEYARSQPDDIEIKSLSPHPVVTRATLDFTLRNRERVTFSVYDLYGRKALPEVEEMRDPGDNYFRFDASRLSAGIYIYRLTTKAGLRSGKMIVLR